MPTNVTFNGTTYPIPLAGELNWSSLSNFLVDVGNNAGLKTIQKQAIRVATSTPITVSATTDYSIVSNLSVPGAVAVNLPAGVVGQIFVVLDGKGDAVTNNITINPNGADTIQGAASLVLNHNYEAVVLQYSSGNWNIVSNMLPSGTITSADLSGAVLPNKGGTGIVNNNASTLAISGNFATTITVSNTTAVTLPVAGTLATLAGTEALTNKDYQGGVASNARRLTLPSDTLANLTALTRKEATLVYATDTDKVYSDDGAALNIVGAGAATLSTNVRASEDGVTVTLTNADLRSQLFNLSGAAGVVVKLPTTGVVKGDVWQMASWAVNTVNALVLTVQSSSGSLIRTLNWESMYLVANVNTPTSATDWRILEVAPTYYNQWFAYTPTVNSNATSKAFMWRRENSDIRISGNIVHSGGGAAANLSISIPSGLTIDTASYPGGSLSPLGTSTYFQSPNVYWGTVGALTSTALTVLSSYNIADSSGSRLRNFQGADGSNNDQTNIECIMKIVEFS